MLQVILECFRNLGRWHEATGQTQLLARLLFFVINREPVPIVTSRHNIDVQILQIEGKTVV